jgi:arylsulfatase A-like enzyme
MNSSLTRKQFFKLSAAGMAAGLLAAGCSFRGLAPSRTLPSAGATNTKPGRPPNVVFVFGDQWRAQAVGYAGDPNVHTPHLDRLADQSVNFCNAVSGFPVCSPYRASLLTGQYSTTHGVIMNDAPLSSRAVSIAQAFKGGGYQTAYIGKWHVDGRGERSAYIPPERRQGFEFWKVLECTHSYNNSHYYAGDSDKKLTWEGYDAIAQTREAQRYLRQEVRDKPFLLMLSWGPPHDPYLTAPQPYRDLYDPSKLTLRPNVPGPLAVSEARQGLAGYYAHCSALDACVGGLLATLKETGLDDNTIFVFTSDHGNMLGSQGQWDKQRPYEESIRVPFLLRWPEGLGCTGRTVQKLIDAPDIMPTLLGLCGLPIPSTVEGSDLSAYARGHATVPDDDAVLLTCPWPFGKFTRKQGGREYRGVRTQRYTYVRDLNGPWLLYDNQVDPYQLKNLINEPAVARTQDHLEHILQRELKRSHDQLVPGEELIKKWGYKVQSNGNIPVSGW